MNFVTKNRWKFVPFYCKLLNSKNPILVQTETMSVFSVMKFNMRSHASDTNFVHFFVVVLIQQRQ